MQRQALVARPNAVGPAGPERHEYDPNCCGLMEVDTEKSVI
jgi:hypothetical protein